MSFGKSFFVVILVLVVSGLYVSAGFADTDQEIQELKQQVQGLMQRIEQLEKQQAQQKDDFIKQKEELVKKVESKVDLSNALSKLKIKGRAAAGFFDSGKAGSFSAGSFEAPEGKLQFSFQPDEVNTAVARFNFNNATANAPFADYLYLQSKDFLPFLKNTPLSLSGKIGRFKLGFGEETWANNPVEAILPSNSVANAGVSDEGLELSGKIKLDKIKINEYVLRPLGWNFSVSDGNSGVGSDNSASKAFMGKLYYLPIDPLYISASYYDSGKLKGASEMSIAGLTSVPTGANEWRRSAWEVDVRYDIGKGKKPLQEPPAYSDSKAILRGSYGQFNDAANRSREGNFGFVDGIYNLTNKYYAAARYSYADLDGDNVVLLNSASANRQDRYSLGLGYRWSDNTILKFSYDLNKESGSNTEDADNDLFSALVATQF